MNRVKNTDNKGGSNLEMQDINLEKPIEGANSTIPLAKEEERVNYFEIGRLMAIGGLEDKIKEIELKDFTKG